MIKFLDEGSYGKVFLVIHSLTKMLFCLKVIEKSSITDETVHQLVREIAIQSHVSHPNIVNLYAFSADKNHFYLLLEPCLFGNLYSRMKKVEEKIVQKYVKEICTAVDYLHKKDIIHRDIKL